MINHNQRNVNNDSINCFYSILLKHMLTITLSFLYFTSTSQEKILIFWFSKKYLSLFTIFLFAHKSAMSRLMFLMSRTNKETKLLRETSQSQLEIGLGFDSLSNCQFKDFSKFYGKAGVVSWLPFSHLKKLCSILRFDFKSWNLACGNTT